MESTTLALGALAIIVTQIGTIAVLMLQRRWDVEDRKALAMKVLRTGEVLAAKVATQGEAMTAHVSELAAKVELGTAASREAAEVANHSNAKINKQQEALEQLNQRLLAKEERPT